MYIFMLYRLICYPNTSYKHIHTKTFEKKGFSFLFQKSLLTTKTYDKGSNPVIPLTLCTIYMRPYIICKYDREHTFRCPLHTYLLHA